jgi:hypothetical protein
MIDTTEGMTIEQVERSNAMQGGTLFLQREISALLRPWTGNMLDLPDKQTYNLEEIEQLVSRAQKNACDKIDAHCCGK